MTSRITRLNAAVQGPFQAAAAFVHALHGEALALQELAEQRAEFDVVVDQQKSHGSECSMV